MPTRRTSSAAPTAPAENDSGAVPRGCTNFKLRQLNRQVSRLYDARVGSSGMKTTQYSLLSHVVSMGPVRPSDLAAAMHLDASTLTRNLLPLVALGWVEQLPGENARSRLVSATPTGRAQRTAAQRAWKLAQAELNDKLGLARVAQLHALLEECSALLASSTDSSALESSDE
ncbi:MAG: hypothetical protein RLZZ618_391 [Pseudomonadota bacterium]|jgi:DNA-binding MarR family transcriptional regulator